MKIVFKTNIDKYKGKFPSNYQIVPQLGSFVAIENLKNTSLPFTELEVKKVTHEDAENIIVELHLSELQAKQNIEYELKVFG